MSVSIETTNLHPHPTEMAQVVPTYLESDRWAMYVRRGRGFAYRDDNGNFVRDDDSAPCAESSYPPCLV